MPIKHTTAYRRIFIALLAIFPLVCARLSPEDAGTGERHDYLGAIIITVVILAIGYFIEKWSANRDKRPLSGPPTQSVETGYWKCPKCSTMNPAFVKSCTRCGTAIGGALQP